MILKYIPNAFYIEVFAMKYSDKYFTAVSKSLVTYNHVSGDFYMKSGEKRKLHKDRRGYMRISVGTDGSLIAHRLAWLIFYGELPDCHIDHIDGNKENNAISNLRACSHNQNQHNQTKRKNNKSGYKGVSWMKNCSRWQAQICLNKKVRHLGTFKSAEDAARAYDAAARDIHGEFAKTNF